MIFFEVWIVGCMKHAPIHFNILSLYGHKSNFEKRALLPSTIHISWLVKSSCWCISIAACWMLCECVVLSFVCLSTFLCLRCWLPLYSASKHYGILGCVSTGCPHMLHSFCVWVLFALAACVLSISIEPFWRRLRRTLIEPVGLYGHDRSN